MLIMGIGHPKNAHNGIGRPKIPHNSINHPKSVHYTRLYPHHFGTASLLIIIVFFDTPIVSCILNSLTCMVGVNVHGPLSHAFKAH